MIPDAKVAEIRERIDIAEIIGEYVSLKRTGGNLKGVCPFHADADPSFNVNSSRQFFHCFGCGASGDVFGFLQRIEGLTFNEAVRRLANRLGITLPAEKKDPMAQTAKEKDRQLMERRLYILEEAAQFFERNLQTKDADQAKTHLANRGIDRSTAQRFRLGYAPKGWSALVDFMVSKRVLGAELENVGLALRRKGGNGFYDRFRNRLMFTITDPSGHPIAFSGRMLEGGTEPDGAKYINSPETPEYTKGRILYGLHAARVGLSKNQEAILVEGNFDVVSMAQAGFENVVAPLGTALTSEQAALLRRRVERVIVLFDGDKAGRSAAARAFPILAKAGLSSYIVTLPDGEDPDSFIRKKGSKAMAELLAAPKGLLDEIIMRVADASLGTGQDMALGMTKLKPFVDAVSNALSRDVYIQRIATAFSMDPKLVFRYMRTGSIGQRATEAKPMAPALPGFPAERELIGLLLDLPALSEEAAARNMIAMMKTDSLRRIAEDMLHRFRKKESFVFSNVEETLLSSDWLARRAMQQLYTDIDKGMVALDEIRHKMEQVFLRENIDNIENRIRLARSGSNELKVLELQRQRTELEKKLIKADQAFDK